MGAEIRLEPRSTLTLDLDADFEHGILLDSGEVRIDGQALPSDHLGYVPTGTPQVSLTATGSDTRLILIGGQPLGERIVMWWNFIGRTHEDVETYRQRWQREIDVAEGEALPGRPWYGLPSGDPEGPLPAPPLPGVRIRPRS
ncbi:pirin-like C-terminal cupin domain-containing protein [Ornithinimicrobium sp. INDO-MA30-4]|uniref:pirin-like C-terminal cupin domain-containing protein n=1 Tax=Ornithinimicrobium sp. INDO-MA30-4 TaxID=2908651 RepID=UPI00288305BB|nr:pirin-like C-terminal cupin domain-containing protein [Ornithinimicrobium sp. INDO-MA30-4]